MKTKQKSSATFSVGTGLLCEQNMSKIKYYKQNNSQRRKKSKKQTTKPYLRCVTFIGPSLLYGQNNY